MSSARSPPLAGRIEHGLERRLGQAQLAPEILDRKVLCDSSSDSTRWVSSSNARHESGSVVSRQGNGGRPPRRRSRSTPRARRTARRAPWRARPAAPSSSGTASSSASRRNAATRSSEIVASCSATPAAGSRVHRGIAVNPPATSTPRQNSRPVSASLSHRVVPPFTVATCHLPLTSGGGEVVAAVTRASPWPGFPPPRVRRDLLALHEEGVGGEHRAVAHRHAVVDEGADPERAAGADRDAVGLEGAVLLRVALDDRCRR